MVATSITARCSSVLTVEESAATPDLVDAGAVSDLYIYPIRGLSGQRLERVTVDPDRGFPFDRCWALPKREAAEAASGDRPLTSAEAYGLTVFPRLAGVSTHLDPETERLRVHVQEHVVLDVSLRDDTDVREAERFFARVLDLDEADRPRLVRRANRTFNFSYTASVSEHLTWACHLVNLASIRDLEERIGHEVDPRRFRANLYVDLGEPWIERDLIGKEFRAGEVVLRGEMMAARCAATEVNLETTERDLPIPRLLKQHYGHTDLGIYANILSGGDLAPGLPVAVPAGIGAGRP